MLLFGFVNIIGLLSALIMAAPHIIFVRRYSYYKTVFDNRAMLYIARLGRIASFFLMSFNIGVLEGGFPKPVLLMQNVWIVCTAVLTLAYAGAWALFFKTRRKAFAAAMIAVSALAVILSGILQEKTLLLTAGIVYLVGEIYLISKF